MLSLGHMLGMQGCFTSICTSEVICNIVQVNGSSPYCLRRIPPIPALLFSSPNLGIKDVTRPPPRMPIQRWREETSQICWFRPFKLGAAIIPDWISSMANKAKLTCCCSCLLKSAGENQVEEEAYPLIKQDIDVEPRRTVRGFPARWSETRNVKYGTWSVALNKHRLRVRIKM